MTGRPTEKAAGGDYDACFYGWTGDNGDPDNFIALLSDKDFSMNVSRWQDKTFMANVLKALQTPNGDERWAQYGELEQYAADRAIWRPISHGKVLVGVKPGISGYVYHVTGDVLFANVEFH